MSVHLITPFSNNRRLGIRSETGFLHAYFEHLAKVESLSAFYSIVRSPLAARKLVALYLHFVFGSISTWWLHTL